MKKIGFLVSHGTDTMAWALSFLSYHIKYNAAPIGLVGSQIPMKAMYSGSDAYGNIRATIERLISAHYPEVFIAFDRGNKVFRESLWKTDKWDDNAFSGKLVMERKSNVIIDLEREYKDRPRKLDELIVIRTGGTIESSMNEHGVLAPGQDTLIGYISTTFGQAFGSVTRNDIMSKDSSDMTPNDHLEIARYIAGFQHKEGFNTFADERFEQKSGVVFCTPYTDESVYVSVLRALKTGVLVGYGGGNVNIENNGFSPLAALRDVLRDERKYFAFTSHPQGGEIDMVYENGRVLLDSGTVLPAPGFSIARAQVKLAHIVGSMETIDKFVHEQWSEERIVAGLFLSGAEFPGEFFRNAVQQQYGIRIPEKDLLISRPVDEAIELLMAEQRGPRSMVTITKGPDFKWPDTGLPKGLIIKPYDFVGYNRRGQPVDAGHELSKFLQRNFEWHIIETKLEALLKSGQSGADLRKKVSFIFGEGGVQTVHDPTTFTDDAPYDATIGLYKELIRARAQNPDTAPGIFICLSHQLYAQALKELVKDALDLLSDGCHKVVETIKTKADNLGINWDESIVKTNEKPEHRIVNLHPFRTQPGIDDTDVLQAYTEVSQNFSGLLEDLNLELQDLVMLHSDEVDHKQLLFVNWALWTLDKECHEHDLNLPIGLEITSSTTDPDTGQPLTEVASMAVYFRKHGWVYRDMTFQFHPELLGRDDIAPTADHESMCPSNRNDGLKLLLAAILFGKTRYKG